MRTLVRTAPATLLVLAATALAAEPGYYAQPALHGEQLVFVSEGDLWSAVLPTAPAAEEIVAHRLTTGDGTESRPRISPDGRFVAFAAQYDGNTDVYVMPIDGGAPRRLTFHPDDDVPLAWAPDGGRILFRSPRRHHFGADELWEVSGQGGMPRAFPFGPCSMVSPSATGRRFAFTPWSNETWHWKGYRGGAAPDIWIGDFGSEDFAPLTRDPANDLLPMWLAGRVFFLSDRSGAFNIHSDLPQGGDHRAHTAFRPDPGDLTAASGHDVRWPGADGQRRGRRIVFCQGGSLALLDVMDDAVTRLDVRLATDRPATRSRFELAAPLLTEIALRRDGAVVFGVARGEVLRIDVDTGAVKQLTHTSGAREWGIAPLGDDRIVLVTDAGGEQQIAVMPDDGREPPGVYTEDRESWLMPPVTSPDGGWLAFADVTMRLHVIDLRTLERRQVVQAEADEITDYRFSPDGQWLAFARPEPGGHSTVWIHALRTQRSFPVSSGSTRDRAPRWDPAGRYLYFLSDGHLVPLLTPARDEHVYADATQVYAVPLAAATPPPDTAEILAGGGDPATWSAPIPPAAAPPADAADPAAAGGPPPIHVDTDGLTRRHWLLDVPPGRHRGLEATWGGVIFVTDPSPASRPTNEAGVLRHHRLPAGTTREVADGVRDFALSGNGGVVAVLRGHRLEVLSLTAGADARTIDLGSARVRVDVTAAWRQMLDEAWRLQRDFFWAPNMLGVDWEAMREKYRALLPRVGTRDELNDVVGEMIGELGTSHAYVHGGARHERTEPTEVSVGLLGADLVFDGTALRIDRILRGAPWDPALRSPLAGAHLGLAAGAVIEAIDGQPLGAGRNVHALLQDRAGARVVLTVRDEPGGPRRDVAVRTLVSERELRYLDWVEERRRVVDEASDGAIGYLHVPDMGTHGLALFDRQLAGQLMRRGLVIDVRHNRGGFASQMVLAPLARRVIAVGHPRHGTPRRYPARTPHAHLAVLIDEHAGSDGDVFPAAFRALELGPLIGARTWGGVVGIRGGKPFVDMGLSTQPEFAWRDERGWSIENTGVRPDLEVPLTPTDIVAGRDPALDRAITELMERLERDPRDLPAAPPYPRRPPR